jgi:hypothetical protein
MQARQIVNNAFLQKKKLSRQSTTTHGTKTVGCSLPGAVPIDRTVIGDICPMAATLYWMCLRRYNWFLGHTVLWGSRPWDRNLPRGSLMCYPVRHPTQPPHPSHRVFHSDHDAPFQVHVGNSAVGISTMTKRETSIAVTVHEMHIRI